MDFPKLLTKKNLYVVVLSAFSWSLPAFCASWHEDGEAGVRVRLPFPPAQVKSGRQIEALIRDLEPDGIADGVHYTSGVYAEGGLPYFLIWKRSDGALPSFQDVEALTRSADAGRPFGLESLAFDLGRLLGRGVGVSPGLARPGEVPLERRVLFQLARGETIFLGFYFNKKEHAAYFEELAASLELAPEKRLHVEELTGYGRMSRSQWMLLAGGASLLFLAAVFVSAVRQSRQHGQAVWLSMNLVGATPTQKPSTDRAEPTS